MTGADAEYDVIIVGGGAAGVCCAGEALLQGLRPLLICETKEVAFNVRPFWIKGNRVLLQAVLISPLWTGGWWLPLAHKLGADIGPMTSQPSVRVSLWGNREHRELFSWYPSAEAMTEAIQAFSPVPLGEYREEIKRVLVEGLAIPFDELTDMDDVLFVDWLAKQTEDPVTTFLLCGLVSFIHALPMEAVSLVTVWGALGFLRAFLAGESVYPEVYPDYREGVFVPMAQAIERKGGTIWRGRKVDRVLMNGDAAVGVRLRDGTEVHAPAVALATGNGRLPSLLDPVPAEVARVNATEWGEHRFSGWYSITLLNREILPSDFNWHVVLNPDPEWTQFMWSHNRAPWGVQPGKQVLCSVYWGPRSRVEEWGGTEALYQRLQEVERFYFPGLDDAIEERQLIERGGMWYSQALSGTKLARRSETVPGLWFVGDGSVPIRGVWTEAAASAGILGARDIADDLAAR